MRVCRKYKLRFRVLAFHQHGNRTITLLNTQLRTCLELNKNNPPNERNG